jgi:hypothetical protein
MSMLKNLFRKHSRRKLKSNESGVRPILPDFAHLLQEIVSDVTQSD